MTVTRLAHLSDPHLAGPMPKGKELLGKRGLSAINWLKRRRFHHLLEVADVLVRDIHGHAPDLIAVGGDLTNFGLAREFERSRAWLETLGPPQKVVAVPGNHDAMARGWSASMAMHWSDYATEEPRMIPVGGVGLVAVSTAIVTPVFRSSGEVGKHALDDLATCVSDARKDGLCPIVMMHHPPTPVVKPRKALRDGPAVCAKLAEAGAAMVLHGHSHRPNLSRIDGPRGTIPVIGIPSFSIAPELPGDAGAWHLLTVAEASSGWTIDVTRRSITSTLEVTEATPLRYTVT